MYTQAPAYAAHDADSAHLRAGCDCSGEDGRGANCEHGDDTGDGVLSAEVGDALPCPSRFVYQLSPSLYLR